MSVDTACEAVGLFTKFLHNVSVWGKWSTLCNCLSEYCRNVFACCKHQSRVDTNHFLVGCYMCCFHFHKNVGYIFASWWRYHKASISINVRENHVIREGCLWPLVFVLNNILTLGICILQSLASQDVFAPESSLVISDLTWYHRIPLCHI